MTTGSTSKALDLGALAEQINDRHAKCEAAVRLGIEHAVEVGRLLMEVRNAVAPGEWGTWVGRNCAFSLRMAQRYVKIARELPKLAPPDATRVSRLSVRDALKLIADSSRALAKVKPENRAKVLAVADKGIDLGDVPDRIEEADYLIDPPPLPINPAHPSPADVEREVWREIKEGDSYPELRTRIEQARGASLAPGAAFAETLRTVEELERELWERVRPSVWERLSPGTPCPPKNYGWGKHSAMHRLHDDVRAAIEGLYRRCPASYRFALGVLLRETAQSLLLRGELAYGHPLEEEWRYWNEADEEGNGNGSIADRPSERNPLS